LKEDLVHSVSFVLVVEEWVPIFWNVTQDDVVQFEEAFKVTLPWFTRFLLDVGLEILIEGV
jgi:hypothetical protein